jgi:undecaprenyl-diphosphatase
MNETIFYFFYNLAHQSSTTDSVIVFLAHTLPFLVLMLVGLFLLFHHDMFKAESVLEIVLKKKREFFRILFSVFFAWLASYLLKLFFANPRPFDVLSDVQALLIESGHAFPSSHAAFFSALAFSIFFMHKKAGYVFMLFALIIGLARIAAGVHFPIDILGGLALGALVAYLVKRV